MKIFDFNPRPPRGGRRQESGMPVRIHQISIHVLREEDDLLPPNREFQIPLFQSTSSARRTTQLFPVQAKALPISIHVLREEDDRLKSIMQRWHGYFNPRPPRGGRPPAEITVPSFVRISIHVLREEDDLAGYSAGRSCYHFNPRPPRGGRQLRLQGLPEHHQISIHVLREEDDELTTAPEQ